MIPATVILEKDGVEQTDARSNFVEDELEALFGDGGSIPDLQQVFHVIANLVDCLLRLSVTMQNPAPHDQFKSRAGEGVLDSYERWDIRHVQEKFSNLDRSVAQRLGKALTRRRQYFRYRLQHHNRLSEGIGLDKSDGRTESDARSTIASSLPAHLKDSAGEVASVRNVWSNMHDNTSDISQTSYGSSNASPDRLRVPPMPRDYIKGPFICQFCQMLVSIDSTNVWKYASPKAIRCDHLITILTLC